MKLTDDFWAWLYFAGMAIVIASLPFLNLGMSIGGFWIAGAWVLHSVYLIFTSKDPFQNLRKIRESKIALLLIGFFLLHTVGLIHTEDINYALKDLRIKLPMLFMPLVFTGIPPFDKRKRNILESLLLFSCSVAALIIIYRFLFGSELYSYREAHPFLSHIRFGLLSAFAAYLALRALFNKESQFHWAFVIPLGVLISYFIFLQSITGIVAFIGALLVSGSLDLQRMRRGTLRTTLSLALLGVVALPVFIVGTTAYKYFDVDVPEPGSLETISPDGKPYFHKWGDSQIENHNLIWYYICWDELAEAWNNRSDIDFEDKDAKSRRIKGTLIRFLTSRGLKKDFGGMAQLSDREIRMIEEGVTCHPELQKKGIEKRLQDLYFEVNSYFNGGNPTGNSLTQRFEFWRASKHILSDRWLIGVGTGDPPRAFERAYEEINSQLPPSNRHRAHNQYLSIFIALGLPGIIWFLSVLVLPFFFKPKAAHNTRYLAFFTIVALSFLTEDTLETQIGQTLFSFFYAYLLILPVKSSKKE